MDTSPIVAVASSAGDLEAVSELLSALPAECRAAFIIVQHLDSGRERLLFEALGKRTILPVIHAHDGAVVEQDHVYVITANTTLNIPGMMQSAWVGCHANAPTGHSQRGICGYHVDVVLLHYRAVVRVYHRKNRALAESLEQ